MGLFDFLKKGTEETADDTAESIMPETETETETVENPDTLKSDSGKADQKAKQEELVRKRDEDGKVLAYLIDRHHELKSVDSFQTVLKSLTTCWLWVPMRMQVSRADAEAMEAAAKNGQKIPPKDPVRLVPSLLRAKDNSLIYCTFSNRDEIPADVQKKHIWMQMPSGKCAQQVTLNRNISMLVINPNSKSLSLKRELLEKLIRPADREGGQQEAVPMTGQNEEAGFTS